MIVARLSLALLFVVGLVPVAEAQTAGSPASPATGARDVSLKLLPPNLAADQKAIWTFPSRLVRGSHWKPALGVLTVTAGLIALDSSDTPYFRRTTSFRRFNSALSSRNTAYGLIAAPAALYTVGLFHKDSYATKTALLAGEAVADAEIVATAMQLVDRRRRPRDIAPNGSFGDSWYETPLGGFPSGHTIAAFSIATVVARRYGRHRWVPPLAYGLAAVVAFSRVSTSSHFPSDVFMGAALGYSIGRFAVLRQ